MLRYADRRAAAASASSLAVPTYSPPNLYRGQNNLSAPPSRQTSYAPSNDGDDDTTAVGTDLSALPPPHPNARAKFNADPIRSEAYFDKDAPPDAVQLAVPRHSSVSQPSANSNACLHSHLNKNPVRSKEHFDEDSPPDAIRPAVPRYNSATLAVPSTERRRAASLDGRNSRPPSSAAPSYQRPTPSHSSYPNPPRYPAPPSSSHGYSGPPPQHYRAPQQQQSFRNVYEDPESDEEEQEEGVDSAGDDSDEDNFTAVGSGVATDMSEEEHQAALYGGHMAMYGRDPRDARVDTGPIERSISATPTAFRQDRTNRAPEYQRDEQEGRRRKAPPPPTNQWGRAPPPPPTYPSSQKSQPPPEVLPSRALAPPQEIVRPASTGSIRPDSVPVASYVSVPRSKPIVPDDSPEEKNLIRLLKDMNFSVALRDFHDTFGLGVRKTIVAADGFGHAFCKIHCTKLPRHSDLAREPHLAEHWVPIAGNRWHFKTSSHRVEVVFKTIGLGTFEATTAKTYGR